MLCDRRRLILDRMRVFIQKLIIIKLMEENEYFKDDEKGEKEDLERTCGFSVI